MSMSTGVGRGHGRHHTGPRAKKPTAMGMSPTTPATAIPPSAKPVKSKHVHHHKGHTGHHSHKRKVK